MDNKRNLILSVVISVGIMIGWQMLFPPQPAVQAPVATDKTQPAAGRDASKAPAALGSREREGTKDVANSGAQDAKPKSRGAEELLTLTGQSAKYVFSTWGAALKEAHLLGKKFSKDGEPLEIVRARDDTRYPLLLAFTDGKVELPDDVAWEVVEMSHDVVAFRAQTAEVTVTKRYQLRPEKYRVGLQITVENRTGASQKHALTLTLFGRQDPDNAGSSFFNYATASPAEAICYGDDDVTRTALESLQKEAVKNEGQVRWVAADERFFTIAAIAAGQEAGESRTCTQTASADDTVAAALPFGPRTVKGGRSTRYPFELYVGPKYRSELATLQVPSADGKGQAGPADLDRVVNVTFAFLSRPMLALLKLFYKVTGNWGFAIIMLTFLVRMITFYPAHKQLLSGKKMARLAPKLSELRKKHGDDRAKVGAETMSMYKEHGVNPLGGCLPALIQMPIWIALFSTLSYSVELYHSAFGLHIQDLSQPDKYYAAPLIMGLVMTIQMRMSPAGTDPQQQKMMSIMMPVMFTGFSLFLPAGLAIYTLTSYSLGIAHQLFVNHLDKKAGPIVPVKKAKAAKA